MMKKIIIMLSLALALTACGAADSSVADDPDVMIETSAFEAAEPVIYSGSGYSIEIPDTWKKSDVQQVSTAHCSLHILIMTPKPQHCSYFR